MVPMLRPSQQIQAHMRYRQHQYLMVQMWPLKVNDVGHHVFFTWFPSTSIDSVVFNSIPIHAGLNDSANDNNNDETLHDSSVAQTGQGVKENFSGMCTGYHVHLTYFSSAHIQSVRIGWPSTSNHNAKGVPTPASPVVQMEQDLKADANGKSKDNVCFIHILRVC